MGDKAHGMLGAVARTAVALAAGIASGALLVAGYIYSSLGQPLVLKGLVEMSLVYGAAIAGISVPLWLALTRAGWDGPLSAAALGFAATALFLLLTYSAGSHDRMDLLANSFLPYAQCGAVAALVTWRVGRVLRRV
jgi:hypothetical protein